MSTVGNFDWNQAEYRGGRALFTTVKFNIFTFILLLFSTHIIYIPVLREYAKLGFDYGNTILVFALIIYLI